MRHTHPAYAARRARAPAAASTPHALGHTPRRTCARLAQLWACLWSPRAALHTGARTPRSGACTRAGQPWTQVRPPGRKTINQRHKYAPRGGEILRARMGTTPKTPVDGARRHWASALFPVSNELFYLVDRTTRRKQRDPCYERFVYLPADRPIVHNSPLDNGVAALFLTCPRGPHRHTAVVTRPRLRLAH